ncbi:MAG TPA: recombinase family protein, partial [Chloroflexota bacterium]|nr:recombinase family protein [Chloroflexota bacterium]
HRQRLAYVYIRQSTLRQVAEHTESQEMQYQLTTRAAAWGWPPERVIVIDEDLGKSAISSQERYGFQRLFTDVGTGKVGLLLVTDVSRLARNCADWYQLLDVAATNHVLVCDSGGVYDPRAYDDRLLLGVKGAFSEAQWHIMRQQMQAARLNKARRGELALRLPIGYERLPNGQVIQTADAQVQHSIHQVFALFWRLGSAHAVLVYLHESGLRLPRQRRNLVGQPVLVWDRPSYGQVYQILKLPAYAGVYAYGQRRREQLPGAPGSCYGGRLPPAEWLVLRPDAFPGYISWQEYMDNQARLAQNWQATPFADPDHPAVNQGVRAQPFSARGAAGKGRALLAGIVICGRCGRPMRVRYRDKPAYVCEAAKSQFNEPRCQFFPYAHVDQAVVAAFLEAAQPAAAAAAAAAVAEMAGQQQALAQQWAQQRARAAYDVALAQTRYEQVDPQLRLVAAELERAWEAALQAQAQLQQEWAQVQATHLQPLSPEEVALVQQMAADLPALWAAQTTTLADRKRLLRTLIADVTLDSTQEAGISHIAVRWQTGAVTPLTAVRPRQGHPSQPQLLDRVRDLAAAGQTDGQMAAILNAEGLVSSWHVKDDPAYVPGQPVTYWDTARVRHLRYKHGIAANPTAGGFVPALAAAERLGVSVSVLLDWFRRGLLPGRQEKPGAPVTIPLDEALLYRLHGRAPRDLPERSIPPLVPLPQAATHFNLSAAELAQGVRHGRFLTWRLEHGSHYRWYVQENGTESAQPADSLPI